MEALLRPRLTTPKPRKSQHFKCTVWEPRVGTRSIFWKLVKACLGIGGREGPQQPFLWAFQRKPSWKGARPSGNLFATRTVWGSLGAGEALVGAWGFLWKYGGARIGAWPQEAIMGAGMGACMGDALIPASIVQTQVWEHAWEQIWERHPYLLPYMLLYLLLYYLSRYGSMYGSGSHSC